jgi:hypothetical protein
MSLKEPATSIISLRSYLLTYKKFNIYNNLLNINRLYYLSLAINIIA